MAPDPQDSVFGGFGPANPCPVRYLQFVLLLWIIEPSIILR
jgi:hypothetical protein